VGLPRLVLATDDTREIARVLRGALRLRTEIVALVEPPRGTGQHLLDIAIPGVGNVSLLAEPAGSERPGGHPLALRPITRVQMAELFSLVERLDEPSRTEPPPPPDDEWESAEGSDDTVVDPVDSRIVLPPFGEPDNTVSPPSSTGLSPLGVVVERPPPPSSHRTPPPPAAVPRGDRSPSSLQRAPDPRIGRILAGKYRIDAPIGSGAAATVYRATHKDLRRAVAVKILHAENQSETQFIRRFKAEALTASKLEHVNVTRVIDFGEENGELYLVMELVPGRTLEAVLAAEGPMPQRRIIDIGIQVCRALVFAHAQGVIHRDIKPENVMLVPDHDDDGEPCDLVKVCDFGLAKMRDRGDGESSVELTVSGMLCGSPAYMSPEQTRGEALDARTDIYSLGVTMFEALTGMFPHEAYSITELFLKKCTEPPRRVSSLIPVDPLLDDILARAMATDPRNRHESARELLTELRTARDQLTEEDHEHNTIVGG